MQTRENLVSYILKGHVHLSKKDYGFFHNIQKLIGENNQITSNQNKLFEKLLLKYSRQLYRLGHENKKLLLLPWVCNVVESNPLFTGASVDLIGNMLSFSCPFNSKFLKTFKSIEDNTFVWDKQHKKYYSQFSTYALKILVTLLPEHFKNVRYSPAVQEILDSIMEYRGYIFNPSLKSINGVLYVIACNEYLYEHLQQINLEETPKCYYELSKLGIYIDDELVKEDPLLKFASSYYVEIDDKQIVDMVTWLNDMCVTHTVTYDSNSSKSNYQDNSLLKNMLSTFGFKNESINTRTFFDTGVSHDRISNHIKNNNPVFIRQSALYNVKNKMHHFSKCITIKNSKEITL